MVLILAEAVSIDGGVLAILLAILLVLAAAAIASMVAGVIWARRAARGSWPALAGFLVVVSAELVLATIGLASSGRFLATVFGVAFLVHIGLFAHERTKASDTTFTDEDPPPARHE